jgi:pimeloyl-ACP methyl ester carboxylesterase
MGSGSVPAAICSAIHIPALVLVGSESPSFKHAAAIELVKALPSGQLKTLEGQSTLVPEEILAPVLKDFFDGPVRK